MVVKSLLGLINRFQKRFSALNLCKYELYLELLQVYVITKLETNLKNDPK